MKAVITKGDKTVELATTHESFYEDLGKVVLSIDEFKPDIKELADHFERIGAKFNTTDAEEFFRVVGLIVAEQPIGPDVTLVYPSTKRR